jgi:hypothetical protein
MSRLLFQIRTELEARVRCKCTEQSVNLQLSLLALEGQSAVANGSQPLCDDCELAPPFSLHPPCIILTLSTSVCHRSGLIQSKVSNASIFFTTPLSTLSSVSTYFPGVTFKTAVYHLSHTFRLPPSYIQLLQAVQF